MIKASLPASRRKTVFSPCREYRYSLWRQWDPANPTHALFICLNPSTADEVKDDPTVRRCIGYAKLWGYGGLCVGNIFAYRSTDPQKMRAQPDPVGKETNKYLLEFARHAGIIVAAWGLHGAHGNRHQEIISLFKGRLSCLGITQGGFPKRPLYLKKTEKPRLFA